MEMKETGLSSLRVPVSWREIQELRGFGWVAGKDTALRGVALGPHRWKWLLGDRENELLAEPLGLFAVQQLFESAVYKWEFLFSCPEIVFGFITCSARFI